MNNKTYYGLFYKSRGKWTGPYLGALYTEKQRASYVKNGYLREDAAYLKSKVSFRKLKFVRS